MSSASQELAGINLTHYRGATGGVRMLMRHMALELAAYTLRVNAIAPGVIETDLNRQDLARPEFRPFRLGRIPLNLIGTPDDVAAAAIFLASDHASRRATESTIFSRRRADHR